MKKIITLTAILLCLLLAPQAGAQSQRATLFPFPTAPDTCTTLESRCSYAVQHWWDKFDASKPLTQADDTLLYDAMSNFFDAMKAGANVNVSLAAVRNLMFKAQVNHSNFERIMNMADVLLYMSPNDLIDDVYLTFARCMVDASWEKAEVKRTYREIIARISASKVGSPITNFSVTTADGSKTKLYDVPLDSAKMVVLLFTVDDANNDIVKFRLSMDSGINDLIDKGEVKVLNIFVGKDDKAFFTDAAKYPKWTSLVGGADLLKSIDIRTLPSFFALDSQHVVLTKNLSIDAIKNAFN